MAYEFENQESATFKFDDGNGNTLTVKNVSGKVTSADTIVRGVQCLLWIGGLENEYNPEDAVRTVKQDVISN